MQPWDSGYDDTLGFDWSQLYQPAIHAATTTGLQLLAGRGGGQGGQQQGIRGSGLIDLMASEYHAMEAAGASVADRLAFSQAALQVLNDPANGPWDSEAYRQQAVAVWQNSIRVLQGQMAGSGQQTAVSNQPGTDDGIDTSTLLMAGGAALLLVLLMRDR